MNSNSVALRDLLAAHQARAENTLDQWLPKQSVAPETLHKAHDN